MSIKLYQDLKTKYETTKPIRGRSVDVRPWGDRRRDWEQVIKGNYNEEVAYGAKLYNTEVVRVLPNGDVLVECGGYATPITAAFIDGVLYGVNCFKQYNKLWVSKRGVGHTDSKYFIAPVPNNGLLTIKYDADNDAYYLPVKPIMEQRVIDPIKAKRARESVTAFKDYVKSILKITEGFVSDDTVRQYVNKGVMEYWNRVYSFAYEDKSFSLFASDMRNLKKLDPLAQSVYDAMCSDNLDVYPKLMCAFLESCNGQRENNDVRKGSHYDIAKVIKKIDDFAINFNQAYMYKEVEITKPLTNLK